MEAPTDGRGTASEETLVYATFDDPAALTDAKEIELVDADGPHPVCIVDGVRYIGRHEVHLGTVLFTSKTALGGDGISSSSSSSSSSDGGSTSHSTFRTGMTSRVLRFRAAEPQPPAAVPAGKAKRAKRPRAVVTEEDATAEGEAEGAAEGAAEEVVDLAEAEGGDAPPGAAVESETKEEAEAAAADGDEGPRRIVQKID
jgi:hypothetical protein